MILNNQSHYLLLDPISDCISVCISDCISDCMSLVLSHRNRPNFPGLHPVVFVYSAKKPHLFTALNKIGFRLLIHINIPWLAFQLMLNDEL